MKAGILARVDKPQAAVLTRSLAEELGRRGVEVLLEKRTAELTGGAGVDEQELASSCDLLVVLGGDGTILRALHRMRGTVPPVFGINLGSLGFLTGVHSDEWPSAVESIAAGDFQLSTRTLLRVQLDRGARSVETFTGLNDAVVSRGHHSQLIKVEVRIDGQELSVYHADGLIVATPTGSTAYSLSCGGPLITPSSSVICITPISPHSLTMRPLIIPDTLELTVKVDSSGSEARLVADGQIEIPIGKNDQVLIKRSATQVKIVKHAESTFFDLLRNKLLWSVDPTAFDQSSEVHN